MFIPVYIRHLYQRNSSLLYPLTIEEDIKNTKNICYIHYIFQYLILLLVNCSVTEQLLAIIIFITIETVSNGRPYY